MSTMTLYFFSSAGNCTNSKQKSTIQNQIVSRQCYGGFTFFRLMINFKLCSFRQILFHVFADATQKQLERNIDFSLLLLCSNSVENRHQRSHSFHSKSQLALNTHRIPRPMHKMMTHNFVTKEKPTIKRIWLDLSRWFGCATYGFQTIWVFFSSFYNTHKKMLDSLNWANCFSILVPFFLNCSFFFHSIHFLRSANFHRPA